MQRRKFLRTAGVGGASVAAVSALAAPAAMLQRGQDQPPLDFGERQADGDVDPQRIRQGRDVTRGRRIR